MLPQTHYARNGSVSIAYEVLGRGPLDLVYIPGWVSNIEIFWEDPAYARFLTRLASFSRLIVFDKQGTGLSDRVAEIPGLEVRMDDVRAVLEAVGSTRTALLGSSEGGVMAALFAATYPERVSALIMHGAYARLLSAPDYAWGVQEETLTTFVEHAVRDWGLPVGIETRAPSMAHDERFAEWWARLLRLSVSPAAFAAWSKTNAHNDIRDILSAIRVPTLVLHSVNDRTVNVGNGRYLAEKIAGAKLVELPGPDHLPWLSDAERILSEIEEFLTGARTDFEPDRVLATVLFTDIVGSTDAAVHLGDRRWHDILEAHDALIRRELDNFRGREISTAGDGFLATFDGPARAIRCACSISNAVGKLGIEVRAGLHTGECERMGDNIGGIAVHIGARVAALARGGVLVSRTVKDLVAGSGLSFEDRGPRSLKSIPGEWQLFAVEH
jgi:pimeloyl-ACP methyl ester carboxylesterase